jgi:Tfp pilus assembly protein PilV
VAAAAHAKERTRNAELVHRLQQLHAEQVGCRGSASSHCCWNSQTASALRLFRQLLWHCKHVLVLYC